MKYDREDRATPSEWFGILCLFLLMWAAILVVSYALARLIFG